MKIANATVLVTGANRGIGLAFSKALLERGARKVYAAARNPAGITGPGLQALRLDVSDPAQVAAAAAAAGDVDLLINNAGIAITGSFIGQPDAEAQLRQHLEVNVFGVLRLAQAFAPVLARNGGGAMLNVASIASWITGPLLGNYAVSKAALWALSNTLRKDLEAQRTQVTTLHMGFVDTELTRGIDQPKASAEEIVVRALDGLEAGALEVLADEPTRQVHQALASSVYLR